MRARPAPQLRRRLAGARRANDSASATAPGRSRSKPAAIAWAAATNPQSAAGRWKARSAAGRRHLARRPAAAKAPPAHRHVGAHAAPRPCLQDEWDPGARLVGLYRAARRDDPLDQRRRRRRWTTAAAWSPLARTVWRFDAPKRDQRLSLTQSYRAPTLRNLDRAAGAEHAAPGAGRQRRLLARPRPAAQARDPSSRGIDLRCGALPRQRRRRLGRPVPTLELPHPRPQSATSPRWKTCPGPASALGFRGRATWAGCATVERAWSSDAKFRLTELRPRLAAAGPAHEPRGL